MIFTRTPLLKTTVVLFLLFTPFTVTKAQTSNWGGSFRAGLIVGGLLIDKQSDVNYFKTLTPTLRPEIAAGFMYNDMTKETLFQIGYAELACEYNVPVKKAYNYIAPSAPGLEYVNKGEITTSALYASAHLGFISPEVRNPLLHIYIGSSAGLGYQFINLSDTLRTFYYNSPSLNPGKTKQMSYTAGFFGTGIYETEYIRYFGMIELNSVIGTASSINLNFRGGIMIPFRRAD